MNSYTPKELMANASKDLPPRGLTTITEETAVHWDRAIEHVIPGVVSIHYIKPCPFDAEKAGGGQATGFIVYAGMYLIFTNRHVIGTGPFSGYCVFNNHEECNVHPFYVDPVHDFGFLCFDPKNIKSIIALELRPDNAKVGTEIRVVGNDAGQKISILSGVISRLDRNAPDYGDGYSDFNTNYIQAAAAASGGSSGSPVVDRGGFVVALQAGGRADGAATDYFLPLHRPVRALELISQGKDVTRGTIQTQWMLKPFDECRRLGLSPALEKEIRTQFPKETGMLVAEVVLPQGPASTKVKVGDILSRVNGELLTQFVRLDEILDDNVGKTISVAIQRAGENIDVELDVGDLHAITPNQFVSVAGGSFHDLSYQQARLYNISLKGEGVYVCHAAGSFEFDDAYTSGYLIQQVNYEPTPDLDTFVKVMKNIADREQVPVSYKHLRELHTLKTTIIRVDRHWSPEMQMITRNDKTGSWDFRSIAGPIPRLEPVPIRAKFPEIHLRRSNVEGIARSFVRVYVSTKLALDGHDTTSYEGYGLVVDAGQGFVLISRAILPHGLCDISLLIAGRILVDAKIKLRHPSQNYAIVQYDVALVDAPVQTPKFAKNSIKKGTETIFFGMAGDYDFVEAETVVTLITTLSIPVRASSPRYRAKNFEAIAVDTNQAQCIDLGVLMSKQGVVQALWLPFRSEWEANEHQFPEYRFGLATPNILPVLNEFRKECTPKLRFVNVEFKTIPLGHARIMGVSEEWIEQAESLDPERHELLEVRKVESDHDGGLNEGDVLLTLNNNLVTSPRHLEDMYHSDLLNAVVVRRREEKAIKVLTVPIADLETAHVVKFCGASFQPPHQDLRLHLGKVPSKVYISSRDHGSQTHLYGVSANCLFRSHLSIHCLFHVRVCVRH
jgi:S1-C subfamily serine protease